MVRKRPESVKQTIKSWKFHRRKSQPRFSEDFQTEWREPFACPTRISGSSSSCSEENSPVVPYPDPNNTKTVEIMTCHCFLWPIRRDLTSRNFRDGTPGHFRLVLCSSMGQNHTSFSFRRHFKCVEFHKKCTAFFCVCQAGHFIPPQLVSAAYLLLHSLWHDRRDAALTVVRKRL